MAINNILKKIEDSFLMNNHNPHNPLRFDVKKTFKEFKRLWERWNLNVVHVIDFQFYGQESVVKKYKEVGLYYSLILRLIFGPLYSCYRWC